MLHVKSKALNEFVFLLLLNLIDAMRFCKICCFFCRAIFVSFSPKLSRFFIFIPFFPDCTKLVGTLNQHSTKLGDENFINTTLAKAHDFGYFSLSLKPNHDFFDLKFIFLQLV